MSYKVLVMIKPGEEQPALDRAAEFARFLPDLELVLFRVITDFDSAQIANLETQYQNELKRLLSRYSCVTNSRSIVVFSKDIADAFCQTAANSSDTFDLAIISANKRNTLRDIFVAPIDSKIMKQIKIPLLIVKDAHAPQRLSRAILLALDVEQLQHNRKIVYALYGAAKIFADNFNGEVHLLNCVPPLNRGKMGGVVKPSSILMGNSKIISRKDANGAEIADFADQVHVPLTHCHIAEGRVDDMIPQVCRALEARMVCMGCSLKEGVLSAFDENVGPLVLEQIQGDIFIVNDLVDIDSLQKHAAEVSPAKSWAH